MCDSNRVKDTVRRREVKSESERESERHIAKQLDRHCELLWRCQGDGHQPAWLYLPALLRLHVRVCSSSGPTLVGGPSLPLPCG